MRQQDEASSISTKPMWVVYRAESGEYHYQPYTDLVDAGTLIDPDSGEDMPIVGWTTSLT